MLATAIAALSLLHFLETLLWAVPIQAPGMIPSLRDSYYFVLESYTTLGEGTVQLPDQWRLIGPIIAMSGLFTFGWTGSVLVSIMTEFGKLDRSRARRAGEDASDGGDPPIRSAEAQRQSRPALALAPHGPITTFCCASSARAVWLPERARSISTRPSSRRRAPAALAITSRMWTKP